jgi:phage terminase large subunit-like protein
VLAADGRARLGKTRSGAEWVIASPLQPDARIALVAETRREAVRVMVEVERDPCYVKGQRPRWSRTSGDQWQRRAGLPLFGRGGRKCAART